MTGSSSGTRRTIELLAHLSAREFRIRYSSALLGWVWAIAPPFARLAVLGVVFTSVLPVGGEDYIASLAIGLLAWTWFASGVASATRSAADRRELLVQPGVPRQVVPLVSVLTDAFDYVVALPVLLLLVVVVAGGLPLTALLLPLPLLLLGALIAGLGMMASVADVRLRDARLAVDLVLAVGFYATPVFYELDAVPASVRPVLALNPVAHLIEAQRALLLDGVLPPLRTTLVVTAVCLLVGAAGLVLHRRAAPTFLDSL